MKDMAERLAEIHEVRRKEIEERFGAYRKPTEETIPKFRRIQLAFLEMALLIHDLCPESKEKSTALTQLQNAKMSANASIAIYTRSMNENQGTGQLAD